MLDLQPVPIREEICMEALAGNGDLERVKQSWNSLEFVQLYSLFWIDLMDTNIHKPTNCSGAGSRFSAVPAG